MSRASLRFVSFAVFVALAAIAVQSSPQAARAEAAQVIRWTGADDADASVAHVVEVLSRKLKRPLSPSDFLVQEDRDLAFNHYTRLVQVADGFPVRGKAIRIWRDLQTGRAIQVEAALESPLVFHTLRDAFRARGLSPRALKASLSSQQTARLTREAVRKASSQTDDPFVRGLEWQDEWKRGQLLRFVTAKGKRGEHHVAIDLLTKKVVSREYREFPQADMPRAHAEDLTIPVDVFPIYEETEDGRPQQRVRAALKNVLSRVPRAEGDIYAPLRTQRYLDSKLDPVLGLTDEGRALGFWAPAYLKAQAQRIREGLPLAPNSFDQGLLLQGRYATINLHPDAAEKFGQLSFVPGLSSAFFTDWVDTVVDGQDVGELIPSTSLAGKPLHSLEEALTRPATRHPEHDARQYLEDGFDELQVYYAIDRLFEELHSRGFTDPELSTRPFNAFLFNPDIAYRDNAYYTDDTINFTTYSPKGQNMARDNSTIWHELGHGIMDRLMGDALELADTGGLSEGMADFLAQIVVQAVTGGATFDGADQFRILNRTGFNLTNEVHDDGEAYGGAMNDFMMAAIQAHGRAGLDKVTDVVLEAMRLTRDYPGLTAADWFNHVLFADELGRPGLRAPGELREPLLTALAGRNFRLDGGKAANFSLTYSTEGSDVENEVVAGKPGSRQAPINVKIAKDQSATFHLEVGLENSESYQFRFPVKVEVEYRKGALQGAIHWTREDMEQVNHLPSPEYKTMLPVTAHGTCDFSNRADGSCVDYAYVRIWNDGDYGNPSAKPVAKKRFYLRVSNP